MKADDQKGIADTFVGLRDPVAIRRPLLEAAKTAVATARIAEHIAAIQEQKLTVRGDLARTLKELRDELSKLQMILPAREVKDTPAVLPAGKKKALDHRIDTIAATLAEIENRMKTL